MIDGAPAYDAIAPLYDIDMAASMRFDDAGWYAGVCREAGGCALEIGCGNGRVLLHLLGAGVETVGTDISASMLAELRAKAAKSGIAPRACRMDARALGFGRHFRTVLCPYSLITYMWRDGDAPRLVDQAARVLQPGGRLVLDAFIPRAAGRVEFTLDYRRSYEGGVLERSKRVTPVAPGINRIERRYRHLRGNGEEVKAIETSEHVRPFSPRDLVSLLSEAGFAIAATCWDYGTAQGEDEAQYFTVVGAAPPA